MAKSWSITITPDCGVIVPLRHTITLPLSLSLKDERKQQFLIDQIDPPFLVASVDEVAMDKAPNIRIDPKKRNHDQEHQLLPHCGFSDSGFPCHSICKNSSNRAANRGCVGRKEAETGKGWQATLNADSEIRRGDSAFRGDRATITPCLNPSPRIPG